jgi:hypothetical protein
MEDTTCDLVPTTMEVPLSVGTVTITPFVVKNLAKTKGPLLTIKKRIEGAARVVAAQYGKLHKELGALIMSTSDVAGTIQAWLDAKEAAVEALAYADPVNYDAVTAADEELARARKVAAIVVTAARGDEAPSDVGIDLNLLLIDCLTEVRFLAAAACDRPQEWVDALGIDDLIVLAAAILKLNQERYNSPKAAGPMAAFMKSLLQVGP